MNSVLQNTSIYANHTSIYSNILKIFLLETYILSTVIIMGEIYIDSLHSCCFCFSLQRLRYGQTSPNQNSVNTPYSSTVKVLWMDT